MATNISAEFHGRNPPTGAGSVTTVSGISKLDVVVNTSPNSTGGWNTATVTADKVRGHYLGNADGVPVGYYEAVGNATFRRQERV